MLLLTFLLVGIGWAAAQNATVKGNVISAEDGEPVIGASILVEGTQLGTITDVDGNFTINGVPASASTIRVSYIGMETVSLAIERNRTMKIQLEAESELLDEVIVTAMGISKAEKTLGYAATNIKSDELLQARSTNIANALSGKVAGVQVSSTSADPGSVSNITIRGFSSINGSNQPLYVVDGIPLSNNMVSGSGKNLSTSGISNIAADDIESMTILKGAAATAIYGSRAANGVIVITTKGGKKGDGRNYNISYSGSLQARTVSTLPLMQNQFGQGWAGRQTYNENGSWGPEFDGSLQVYGPIWNGQQLIHKYSAAERNLIEFFETGISQNHSVSIDGVSGDNKMDYYLSFNYSDDDGIMPNQYDTYKRNTIAYRSSYQAADWIKVSSSVNFARAKTKAVGSYQGTSVIDGLYELPRDISIIDMKDTKNPFFNPEAYLTSYGITNPYWALENNYNNIDSKQVYGKIQADINPIKNLVLTYRMGYDYSDHDSKTGAPQITLDDALIDEDYGYAPSKMNQEGSVSALYSRRYEINNDFLAAYNSKFNRFELNATAGVNINERASTQLRAITSKLTFNTGFWDLSNGATKEEITEVQSKRRLVGLFGDVTLGFDDYIFLGLTARNDWSSTLPIGNNSFFYPGATVSWVFSKLIPENNILSFGKLRASYGKTGNDASVYNTSARYVQGYANGYYAGAENTFPMNGTNAFILANRKGSSTLRPEMTTEFEIGTNMQFFNGRLGFDLSYYNKNTDDQIFTLPVDPATGYTSMVTNFGTVNNNGIELVINTTPIQTRNVKWDIDFNYAKNNNKVVSLPESLEGGKVQIYSFAAGDDAVYLYAEQGKPLGQFYTYLTQYTEDGKMIVDAAGQPLKKTTVEDTGKNMNNDWIGGITSALTIKNITLSAAFDVRMGGYMFSRTKNLMQFTGNGIHTTYNQRRPFVIPNSVYADANGDYVENTTPIYLTNDSYQKYYDSYGYGHMGEAYLIDRSFAKLRNISITYNVPKRWIRSLSLSNVAVTAFCNNVFTWTAADNTFIDPEATTVSQSTYGDLATQFGELYANPSCRVFGCNLNIKF